ncbi:MAG: DPP IV N-terminal domain-containing protein, partial [Bacteroidota bacterium]
MIKNILLLTFATILSLPLFTLAQPTKPAFSRMDVFELEWVTSPQISPDGSMVVYERRGMDIMKDRKTSSLWLMSVDGQSHYKLTSREVNESSPSWSPDGSRIAFVSAAEGHGSEIYVYWVKNDKVARLTQTERSPSSLSWSPDGEQLTFSMLVPEKAPTLVSPPPKPKGAEWAEHPRVTTRLKHESDGSGYIEPGYRQYFVLPADGGTGRQVTQGEFQHRSKPVWTKDGQALIFSSNRNDNWEYDFRNSEIYRVSIVDGEVTALTNRSGPDREPTLSPDGSQILYIGFDD